MKNQLSKILAMVIAVLMVVSMFSFAAFAATEDTTGSDVVATSDEVVITPDEVVTPDGPTETPDEPTETPDEPVETPDEPTETPDEPVETPDEPVETPDEPATADEAIYGDVDLNGKVNVKDATLIQKIIAGLASADELQLALADVNADGKVNVKDATEIQKWIAELTDNALIGTAYDAENAPEVPEVETPDEPTVETPDEPADETPDETETPDEPAVPEMTYYLEGYINGADYYGNDYAFVDGTVTIELTVESYFYVRDENGNTYWTDGWKDFNPGTVTLGQFGVNDKMHVAAGTVTFTFDAATFTLTATVA